MTGTIIAEKLATMKELEVFYSYDDVLTLYEVLIVERHNERVLLEEVRGKRRL